MRIHTSTGLIQCEGGFMNDGRLGEPPSIIFEERDYGYQCCVRWEGGVRLQYTFISKNYNIVLKNIIKD